MKHLHNLRGPGGGGGSVVGTGPGNAVGRRQILLDLPELVVNVWRMRLGVPHAARRHRHDDALSERRWRVTGSGKRL